jgi:uncharacterized repeat protein (TIGR03843 family)
MGDQDVHHPPSGVAFTYDATIAPADTDAMLDLLNRGDVEVLGLMPWSSNGTFLVEVSLGEDHAPAIYKPESAERPLWDFPEGLWRREVAAWELSEALGFALVPPTVCPRSAPMGRGSVQAFVPARFEEHYFTLCDTDDPGVLQALQALCVFDLVANSTDRKGGHCLIDDHDRIWAIDNGLSFHTESKLRTVLWDFAGRPIPESLLVPLRSLIEHGVPGEVTRWLAPDEADAILSRAAAVLDAGRFPHDPSGRSYPWPLI